MYSVNELDDAAKAKARQWYIDRLSGSECWYEPVFDDFETICTMLGITIKRTPRRVAGQAGEYMQRCIYFRGFGSQGDGASFEGRWEHAARAAKRIRSHAPKDEKLHRIADTLAEVQKRNFHQLAAEVAQEGMYTHEHSMSVDVERDSERAQEPTEDAHETVRDAMRDLARWLYRAVEAAWTAEVEDDAVDEAIESNGWMFRASGAHFPL